MRTSLGKRACIESPEFILFDSWFKGIRHNFLDNTKDVATFNYNDIITIIEIKILLWKVKKQVLIVKSRQIETNYTMLVSWCKSFANLNLFSMWVLIINKNFATAAPDTLDCKKSPKKKFLQKKGVFHIGFKPGTT